MPSAPTDIRHDLDPLTSRFPLVGHPLSALWVTWHSASGGVVPGPATYWIDAVITLEWRATTALVAQYRSSEERCAPRSQGVEPSLHGLSDALSEVLWGLVGIGDHFGHDRGDEFGGQG